MVLTKALVLSIARSLLKSLLLSCVVLVISMVLMTFSPSLATLALLAYSCTMIVKSSRQPLPLHWFTVLLPGAMAAASFGVQILLFSGIQDPAQPVLSFGVGLLPGLLLGRAHKIFQQDGRLYAKRTYGYVLIWVLALLATQGGALIGLREMAGYGVMASGFSTSMLVTLSFCLLLKYLKQRGNVAVASSSSMPMGWLAWLLVPYLAFVSLPPGQAAMSVYNADEAAQIALKGSDFDRTLPAKWQSWQQFTDTVAPRSQQQDIREALDSIRSVGRDIGTVGYFGKLEDGLYAQGRLVVVFNPAKLDWVVQTGYRAIYGVLMAWAKLGNQVVAALEAGSDYPTRFHTELCGKDCVAFSYQCGTFAINDTGPWTAIVYYQLLKPTIQVNWPYVYETYEDPDLAKCFWRGVREDGLRLIKTIDSRLSKTDYLDAEGRKPEMGPIASLLSLIRDLLKSTGKFSDAAIAAGLSIALIQLLSGAGLTAAITAAEAAAQEAMRAAAAAQKSGTTTRPSPPAEAFDIPPPPQTNLIDPDTGQYLVVHDGKSDYGKGYEGGKCGQVWYGDQWVDQETAAKWIEQREQELRAREDQRKEFWEQSAKEKIAQQQKDIVQKIKDGYRYDDKTGTWYIPGQSYQRLPETPDPHAGYEYDAETDTWHLPGWEYDYRTGAWRDVKAETGGFEPTEIEPEKGDVTRPRIPAGFLLPGDPGSFFDPKDLSAKELKDAAVRWARTRIDGSEYDKIYPDLEKRRNYLNKAERDALDKYQNAVAKLRQARETGGDPWLEQKLQQVWQKAKDNVDRVRRAKLDLTYRLASGSEGGKQYTEYEQKYRKEWTVGKVGGEAVTLVKEMFVPNVEWLGPIVKDAVEAQARLRQSALAQPELFKEHEALLNKAKATHKLMLKAQANNDTEYFKELRQQLDQQRGQLKSLTDAINQYHKDNLRWQARTIAALGAMSMTAQQIGGAVDLQMQMGDCAANYLATSMSSVQTRISPLDMGREQRAKLYDWDTPGAPRLKEKSGGAPPRAAGAGGGDDSGGPKIPDEFAQDYNALQRALANGDEVAANRHAARMAVKDYAKFKGMVDGGDIDPAIGNRALNTHQEIIKAGVRKGVDRTHNMGRLLGKEYEVDADGNISVKSPIERVYAPGSGMEPFDPANPRMPGDADLSPIVNRKLCQQRGLDPDRVQQTAARNIKDAINEEAAARLGGDIGDYCQQTKVKMFEPGSPEEVTSFSVGKMKGKVIDNSGRVLEEPTTLGREMYGRRTEEIADIVSRSRTGRAMDAADEAIQIKKTVDEIYRPRLDQRQPSPDDLTEGAREIGKHMGRSQQKVGWDIKDIDTAGAGFKDNAAKQGFAKTLEAAQSGDPKAIQQAIDSHYGGNYKSFYEDCQNTSNYVTQKQLKNGGKIWADQADRLQQAGMSVERQGVISHQAPKTETAEQYLERMGVPASEQKMIQAQRAAEADLADVLSRSKSGRAIDVADSSIRIQKAIDDIQGPRVNVDDHLETAHTIGKQMESLQNRGRWNVDEMDTAMPLNAKNGQQGFAKTLDAAMGGDSRAIKNNIQQHYDGDFNKFYDDCQKSCQQAIQKQLDGGGKIWGEQAASLQRSGMSVEQKNIISPHAPKDEGVPQYLKRMGVADAEQKQIRVQRTEERAAVLAEGGQPDLTGRTLDPTKTYLSRGAHATPGARPPENVRIALESRPRLRYIDQEVREAWSWTAKGGAYDKADSWDNFQRGLDLKVAEGKLTFQEIDDWWRFMDQQWGRAPADATGPEVFIGTRPGANVQPLQRPPAAGGATRAGPVMPGTTTGA